jgi:hypothetical protein
MRIASWVLLTVVGALVLTASLISAWIAYRTESDRIAGKTLSELSAGNPEVLTALKARRGTAAAYTAGFATLFLTIVVGPYRKGSTWAWWALLEGALVAAIVSAARIPSLGTIAGAVPAGILLGVVIVGLLLDMRRLGQPSPAP